MAVTIVEEARPITCRAAAHPPDPGDLDGAVSHYAQLAAVTGAQVGGSGGAQAAARLRAETGNMTAMLERAAADGRIDKLADGMYGLVEYWRFAAFAQPALVDTAEHTIEVHGTTVQQAQMWGALGDLAYAMADLDGARACYERALPLYQQAGAWSARPAASGAWAISPGPAPILTMPGPATRGR
jgi:hypothetical protein